MCMCIWADLKTANIRVASDGLREGLDSEREKGGASWATLSIAPIETERVRGNPICNNPSSGRFIKRFD